MKYEELLTIALSVASVIQLFLSFLKGRSRNKDSGDILAKLSEQSIKRKFLALLFIGLIGYLAYVIVTGYFSVLGIMIIIYFLLSIYDFSKSKIVTTKGIGQKSLYSNTYYNFAYWSDIVEWKWAGNKENLLLFKIRKKDKIETKDWQVSSLEKENINSFFEKYTNQS